MRRAYPQTSIPSESQSQDSTQQPSIDIQPAQPIPFIRPLTPIPESSSGPSVPTEESIPKETLSDEQPESGSSLEETGDSGVAWTQSQLNHNATIEAEQKVIGVQGSSDSRAIVPFEASVPNRPPTKSPSPSPQESSTHIPTVGPTSPETEKDNVEDSVQQGAGDKVDAEEEVLEATEVDASSSIEPPEQSQLPLSPPRLRTTTRPHHEISSPKRSLAPCTSFSPTKLTNRSIKTPQRASSFRRTLSLKKKKTESLEDSEESLFGKDLAPVSVSNPVERLSRLLKGHSEPISNGRSNFANKKDSKRVDDKQQDQRDEKSPPEDEKRKSSSDEEEEDVPLNWDESIAAANGHISDQDVNDPKSSPLPQLAKSPTPLSPQNLPQLQRSRFGQFAGPGSTASDKLDNSQKLFSSQAEESYNNQESQRSVLFQATQLVARQPSSPPMDYTTDTPPAEIAFEATQADETQLNEETIIDHGHVNDREGDHIPAVQALSRAPSHLSNGSRTVPSHRLLQRRSRPEMDDGKLRTPFRGPDIIPPTGQLPNAKQLRLKPTRSEADVLPAGSSPFKKSSPIDRHKSEASAWDETLKNSLEQHSLSTNGDTSQIPLEPTRENDFQAKDALSGPSPSHSGAGPIASSSRSPSPRRSSPLIVAQHSAADQQVSSSEVNQYHGPSSPRPASPQLSRNQNGVLPNRRRASSAPVQEHRGGSDASHSSSAPEDEEDHTYRPAKKIRKHRREPGYVAGPPAGPSRMPNTDATILSKRKRKRVVRSSSLSNPPSDEDKSSSPAPEDPEDNTYQPTLVPHLKLKPEKGKSRERPSAPSSKGSSRPPNVKKSKTNAQVAVLSPSLSLASEVIPETNSETHRVLAAYYNRYYPGLATWTGKSYKIDFDDGERRTGVKAAQMRQLVFVKGDRLEASTNSSLPERFIVSEDWDGNTAGVRCRSEQGGKLGRVQFNLFGINAKFIHSKFGDRLFEDTHHQQIPTNISGLIGNRLIGISRRASEPRSPVKRSNGYASPALSRRSATPTRKTSDRLKGTLFILTRGLPDAQQQLSAKIRSQGGKTTTSWEELFDRSSPGECGFAKNLAGTPFLILLGEGVEGTIMTPKVMTALAKGIPCLSAKFVADVVDYDEKIDWRSYLISPGFSNYVGHHMSQVVDTTWGEEGWIPSAAIPVRRPFKGNMILFIIPGSKYDDLKRLIPLCAYSMGVEDFTMVPNTKSFDTTIKDAKWDYILLEDREYLDKKKPLPKNLQDDERLCNVHWLKQCLITGSVLPPSLDADKETEKDKKK
ncbi:uncharacterized protein IL334_002113 [Kwoniella shivajii]|uniref:BRCT domain-containing protein n=1 Tax=Kwoniella shivajii TaxID=564305 RepID=A0ABZ1CTT9_9TREE|nr:hypothetical protein IL334_002113 [Kwoniella shivajii]